MHALNQSQILEVIQQRFSQSRYGNKLVALYLVVYQHAANRICYESLNLTFTEIRSLQHT